jgi:hypothetical protein
VALETGNITGRARLHHRKNAQIVPDYLRSNWTQRCTDLMGGELSAISGVTPHPWSGVDVFVSSHADAPAAALLSRLAWQVSARRGAWGESRGELTAPTMMGIQSSKSGMPVHATQPCKGYAAGVS